MVDFGTKRYATGVTKKYAWKTYVDADYTEVSDITRYVYKTLFTLAEGARLLWLGIKQINDESACKYEVYAKYESDTFEEETGALELESDYFQAVLMFASDNGVRVLATAGTTDMPFAFRHSNSVWGMEDFVEHRLSEGHSLTVSMKMDDVLGTNQKFAYKRIYQMLEEVT